MDWAKCKFISDGTWFDKGTEAKLTVYLDGAEAGLFTGIINGEPCGKEYGEQCQLSEFFIYDEYNVLIGEPTNSRINLTKDKYDTM